MIPLDTIRSVKTIIVHAYDDAACPDGLASAMILHDALPEAEVLFVTHEQLKMMPPMKNTLFCDICPHADFTQGWIDKGACVLDHHVHQKEVVERFSERGVYSGEPGVSGAVLAYEHVWNHFVPGHRPWVFIRDFAKLAGVRDTWQNEHPAWIEACAQAEALRFYPIDDWMSTGWDEVRAKLAIGPVLLKKRAETTRAAIAGAEVFTVERGASKSLRFLVMNTIETSDVLDAWEGESPPKISKPDVVVGFTYRVANGVPKMILSLRSRGEIDVGKWCKAMGGGGHKNAAGVTLSTTLDGPYNVVRDLAREWVKL